MQIENLYNEGKLSFGAYNICRKNDFNTTEDLNNYLLEGNLHDFKKLRQCGESKSNELLKFCDLKLLTNANEEHISVENLQNEVPKLISNFDKSINFSEYQLTLLDSYIEYCTNMLNRKSKMEFKSLIGGNLNFKNFSVTFAENKHIKESINKKTEKTKEEIYDILEKIDFAIDHIFTSNLNNIDNNLMISQLFLKDVPLNFENSSEISIFQLIKQLLENNDFWGYENFQSLLQTYNIYNTQNKLMLSDATNLINVSRERIRQLRKKYFKIIQARLQFLKFIQDEVIYTFILREQDKIIYISDELSKSINEKCKTNFTKEFITFLVFLNQKDNYQCIGILKDHLLNSQKDKKNKQYFKNLYLIKNEINEQIKINDFILETSVKIIEGRVNDEIIYFDEYIFKYINNPINDDIDQSVKLVFKSLLKFEFNIDVSSDSEFVLPANKEKKIYELIIDALDEIREPASLDTINQKIREMHPEFNKESEDLRAHMRQVYGIMPFDNRSNFMLKKWEDTNNITGGGIREIIRKKLEESYSPLKIDDLVIELEKNHVENILKKNILSNLKQDNSCTFIFFEDNFIGLSDKKYGSQFQVKISTDKTKITWDESYLNLINFINKNGRLPSYSKDGDSKKLYRWLMNQKANFDNLSNDKKEKIMAISNEYILKNNDEIKYKKLKDFILENQRMPKSSNNNEDNLYRFWRSQLKFNKDNKLEEDNRVLFLEIIEIIKSLNINTKEVYIDNLLFSVLEDFINNNKILPKEENNDEKMLRVFLNNKTKMYNEKLLNQEEEGKLKK